MKKASLFTVVLLFVTVSAILTGCPRSTYNPSSPYLATNTFTATPTATGPTFTVTSTPTLTATATITNTPTVTSTATITNTPTITSTFTFTGTPTNTATSTPTSTPVTITVSAASSSLDSSGYIYTVNGVSNSSGGLLVLTAHVGDTIVWPASTQDSGFHPLYFDAGSSSCIYSGITSTQETYTFTSTGTYYFHCGNHANSCSAGDGACGSTNCNGMAGVITVSP